MTAWLLSWGERPSGVVVLVLLTLLEATVFPAPTEAMRCHCASASPDARHDLRRSPPSGLSPAA
jgi:hypothetical protein